MTSPLSILCVAFCFHAVILMVSAQQNETVVLHSNSIIHCQVTEPDEACFWVHGGLLLSSHSPDIFARHLINGEPMAGTCDLEIKGVVEEDAGKWICLVPGNDIKTFQLEVVVRPSGPILEYDSVLYDQPETVVMISKGDVGALHYRIMCSSHLGRPSVTSLKWFIDDRQSDGEAEVDIKTFDDGLSSAKSRLRLTFRDPDGDKLFRQKVTCSVQHPAFNKEDSHVFNVTVIFQEEEKTSVATISLKDDQEPFIGDAQSEVTLECVGDGNPKASKFKFYMFNPETNENIQLPNQEGSLLRSVAVIKQPGKYFCEAANLFASELAVWAKSNEITIYKDAGPAHQKEATQGSNVVLECAMENGDAVCFWLHGSKTAVFSHKTDSQQYKIISDPANGVCNLQIKRTRKQDGGIWQCRMSGNRAKVVNLIVKNK